MCDAMNPSAPVVWIVSTGSEILQGKYADSNAQWLSRRLLEWGLVPERHMALPDDPALLRDGIRQAAEAADLILMTGGLGPTVDDYNRQIVADLWGVELEEDAESVRRIEERFARLGRETNPSNRAQAMLPAGCKVIANDWGTAPGFYLPPKSNKLRAGIIAMPGVPREMKPMFEQNVLPLLERDFAISRLPRRVLTFHTTGVPESLLNEHLKDLFNSDPEVDMALLAGIGQVDVRLMLKGRNEKANDRLAETWRAQLRERLGEANIWGEDGKSLADVVGHLILEKGFNLATAESCTGGLLAGELTSIPGASAWFHEGFVTYTNEAKILRLGVSRKLLDEFGAVSPQVAAAMASGARAAVGVEWAVSVTGIAGPSGGTPEKPVGLVYLGLAGPGMEGQTVKRQLLGDREEVRRRTVMAALDLLRRALLGLPFEPELPRRYPA